MNRETDTPITNENVLAIAALAKANPPAPVVVPVSYGKVLVPQSLPDCIDGATHDPDSVYIDDRTVQVGPSFFRTDEHGRIYDARVTGITAQSLLSSVWNDTGTIWTLHLNLADPSMPRRLSELHRAKPAMGLVAIVIPQAVQVYMEGLKEFDPVLYRPDPKK